MALICVIAVYNEAPVLADCLRSVEAAGVDDVHVFDGAWRGGAGAHVFAGARSAASSDATDEIATAAGATFHPQERTWPSQEAKRTAMFHRCGAGEGDSVLIVDADERLEGRIPAALPEGHACLLGRSIGENDLPGVRGVWPDGDYSPELRPCFRVLGWSGDLRCLWPGGYETGGALLRPFRGTQSRLPILPGVILEHHALLHDPERIAAKRAYYEAEHPDRQRRVLDYHAPLPPGFRPFGRVKRILIRGLWWGRRLPAHLGRRV